MFAIRLKTQLSCKTRMAHSHSHSESKHEDFSIWLFLFTILTTLAGLLAAVRFIAPHVWAAQLAAPIWLTIAIFLIMSVANCFMEFFFHRYVLHTPALPFIRRLYKQHTLHHALTRIGRGKTRDGRNILLIENKFPILEPEQTEASFFPWYSLAAFAAFQLPFLIILQLLLPSCPWFISGFAALAVSLLEYEIFHAINHWSLETWDPLISHPRFGRFWRIAYAFHLRHHAVIDCNESISGFFGLPLADWAFGTCVIPTTIYADGEEWLPAKFVSPKPVWFIQALDKWAKKATNSRRFDAKTTQAAQALVIPQAESVLPKQATEHSSS